MNKWGYFIVILAVIAFSGCSSKPKKTTQPPPPVPQTPATIFDGSSSTEPAASEIPTSGTSTGTDMDISGGTGAIPSERVVYFDYDKSEIRPEARAILGRHAAYLSNNPNIQVRLEGHADERGSREYNLALGELRAESAKNVLSFSGVSENQLNTLSYGEERPMALGHNESAWQRNRRVELVYP